MLCSVVLVLVIIIVVVIDTFQTHVYIVSGVTTVLFKNNQSISSVLRLKKVLVCLYLSNELHS